MNGPGLVRLIRSVFESEQLEVSPESGSRNAHKSFVSRLLSAEDLPFDKPAPAGPQGAPRLRLFAAELLPADEPIEPVSRRKSFLGWLFSGEDLPKDQVTGGGTGGAGTGR